MNFLKKSVIACFALFLTNDASAQLYPMGTQYFQNQFMANPALAGYNEGLMLNGALRQQWSNIPGAPVTAVFSADYRLKEKVGIGMNIFSETTGLIERTRMMGSYAYQLPLGAENQALHFGISLGLNSERVAQENLNGDTGDMSVARFNQRETYLDGDFGVAYIGNRLNVQAAIPNMKSFIGTDEINVVNQSTFFSSISYKWPFGSGMNSGTVEPKAVYRGVRGYDNMLDLGANLKIINNQLIVTGMYHSTKSATFGFGFNYNKALSILGMYTTETAALRGYANGNFEIGLGYQFLKKGKQDN